MPYYPKEVVYLDETRFGVKILSNPMLYEKPIDGRTIVRVDTLKCLSDVVGQSLCSDRNRLFGLVSGLLPADMLGEKILECYKDFPEFRIYVNDKYTFGNEDQAIVDRVIMPLVNMVNDQTVYISDMLNNKGGKFLANTHDYLYFSFRTKPEALDCKGVEFIC